MDQLARLGFKPQQVALLGVSHDHFDHTGQAADFAHARLLIGKDDLERLRQSGGERDLSKLPAFPASAR